MSYSRFRQDQSLTGIFNALVAVGQAPKNMQAERPQMEAC